jgi:prepilin-type N-terminal cleavage/methylation domain-containing protein
VSGKTLLHKMREYGLVPTGGSGKTSSTDSAPNDSNDDPTEGRAGPRLGLRPHEPGVRTMCDARQERIIVESERGFSLIEVLVSIMITLIVMGAVFRAPHEGAAILPARARGRRSPAERAHRARPGDQGHPQAGAGLPGIPAFSRINGAGDAAPAMSSRSSGRSSRRET